MHAIDLAVGRDGRVERGEIEPPVGRQHPHLTGCEERAHRAVRRMGDETQRIGIGDGQFREQQRMDHPEDRRVRADAEAERGDRDQGEDGRPTERARGVAQVLPRHVEPARHAHPARLFLEVCRVSELAPRREAGVVGWSAIVRPLLLREALMDRVLLGALAVRVVAAERGPDSVAKGVDERHGSLKSF